MDLHHHKPSPMFGNSPAEPVLIYDGDCPFCASYVQLVHLRETFGAVQLVNARGQEQLIRDLADRNMPLDDGMVLVLNGEYYHGSDCVHRLALLGTSSNMFNRINKTVSKESGLRRYFIPS